MARAVVWRTVWCRGSGCGAVFYICGSCYRGQTYCGDRCRAPAQRHHRRTANRRHQRSLEGRLDHRDRQRAYRARRRLRGVTDTPSAGRPRSATISLLRGRHRVSNKVCNVYTGVLQRFDVGGHGDRRNLVEVEPARVCALRICAVKNSTSRSAARGPARRTSGGEPSTSQPPATVSAAGADPRRRRASEPWSGVSGAGTERSALTVGSTGIASVRRRGGFA